MIPARTLLRISRYGIMAVMHSGPIASICGVRLKAWRSVVPNLVNSDASGWIDPAAGDRRGKDR